MSLSGPFMPRMRLTVMSLFILVALVVPTMIPSVAGAVDATERVSITGTHEVGQSLSADLPENFEAGGPANYQWFKGGQPISGATYQTYIPGANDTGQAIWVRIEVPNMDSELVVFRSDLVLISNVDHGNNQVLAVGSNGSGQLNVPDAASSVVAVDAGLTHNLGLRSNGTVVVWGADSSGPNAVPDGLNNVVSVSAGYHNLALKSDGTVVSWGNVSFGNPLNPPDGLTDVVDIEAGYNFALALKSDGTVVVWGDGADGQLAVPVGLTGVQQISAGAYHALALKSDGTVVGWGLNTDEQITIPEGLSSVVDISAGYAHSSAIKSDGSLVVWGTSAGGITSVPDGTSSVVQVSSGFEHTVALKSDGTVVTWGSNANGQLDGLSDATDVFAVSAGQSHSVLLRTSESGGDEFTIDGEAVEGKTLSVVLADWVAEDAELEYQWYRNSSPISGATGARYTIQSADLGASLKVKVTGVKRGYTTSSRDSKPSGKILASSVPQVTGTVAVGSTVGVSVGSWTSKSAFSYQWLRNGVAISKATKSTYKLSAADAAAEISVRLTGKRSCYQTVVRTSAATQKVMTAATPSVSGEFIVGEDLTANIATWTDGVAFSYQWLRNGQVMSGETNQKYTVQAADVNQSLRVRVTGSKAGFATIARDSVASLKVPLSARPTVQGTPSVGSTLNVVVGSWTAKTAFSYQWLRDGVPISKATKSTYKLTSSDAGKTITVRVTGKKSGYATVSRTSSRSD